LPSRSGQRGLDILITDLAATVTFVELCEEVKTMCSVASQQPITLKWIDDEGDPCTISSQMELEEALRIYSRTKRSGLLLHVFPSIPEQPGMLCPGEDKSIYRRGARRWRKLYRVNGHLFQAKRFNRKAYCAHCSERIWGLGSQGYKCINCKLLVHKRCHRLIPQTCQRLMDPVMPSQKPPSDAQSAEVDLPLDDTEDTDGSKMHFFYMSLTVVDGIDGIKISQGLVLGLGDFDLIRVIGRGSYAKVLLVRLKKNEQMYAMKVVKKELVHDDEVRAPGETLSVVFKPLEPHDLVLVSSNRFLVAGHQVCTHLRRLFLVIEYVNGGDLMFHMQRQRKLPEEHARFYAAEICIALNFLHEKGIIYRDLKLDNVLLDHEGHIKLTDYGMCKEGIRPGDTTSTFCGTPNYIAPEILRGEDYGFSVDWWALGVLMFEMMAGRSPFDIITDNPDMNTEEYLFQVILEKPIRIPRSLSVKAAGVLKGFLNKDPKERLGCQVQTGFTDIKSHTFFRSIDWEQLEKKEVTPPFKPQISDEYGLENFDTQFTNEPVQLTPDDEDVIKRIDQSEFEGFEYINPLLLATEESV
uniref:Protein kinase C n=1 Tax=Oreochromis niloticus TaxID=8128 RepID=A0A669DG67_ORENI